MADMTATTMATWVPAVLSKSATMTYRTECVLAPKMDRRWEPELGVGRGNIINIPGFTQNTTATARSTFGTGAAVTFDAVTEGQTQLQVNKMAYKAFRVPCEMAPQAMALYFQELTKGIGQACQIYLDGQLASDNSNGLDALTAIGTDNVDITLDTILLAQETLNLVSAPTKDRFFVVSPGSQTSLFNIDSARNSLYATSMGTLKGDVGAGSVTLGNNQTFLGKFLTFEFWMSNNLESGVSGKKNAAFQREAIALCVQQDIKFERGTNIADGVFYETIGWLSFGHKMVKSGFGNEVDGR